MKAKLDPNYTVDFCNEACKGKFPDYCNIRFTEVREGSVSASMSVLPEFMAPNGYLHAGSLVTLADTVAGFSSLAHLPEKAKSFTTIELKSSFLGTTQEGTLIAHSEAEHLGRTTHVWRVEVRLRETNKKLAVFMCTQLVIY